MPLEILELHPGWAKMSDEQRTKLKSAVAALDERARNQLYDAIQSMSPPGPGDVVRGKASGTAFAGESPRTRAMRSQMSPTGEYMSATGAPMSIEHEAGVKAGASGLANTALGAALMGPVSSKVGPVVSKVISPRNAGIAHGVYSYMKGDPVSEAVLKGMGTSAILGGKMSPGSKAKAMVKRVLPRRFGRAADMAERVLPRMGSRAKTAAGTAEVAAPQATAAAGSAESMALSEKLAPEMIARIREMNKLGIPEKEIAQTVKRLYGSRVAGLIGKAPRSIVKQVLSRETAAARVGGPPPLDIEDVTRRVTDWRSGFSMPQTIDAFRRYYGMNIKPSEARRIVTSALQRAQKLKMKGSETALRSDQIGAAYAGKALGG